MNEFSLEMIFPWFHLIFGAIMALTGLKVIKTIKDEQKLEKYKLFLIIGGGILFFAGLLQLL